MFKRWLDLFRTGFLLLLSEIWKEEDSRMMSPSSLLVFCFSSLFFKMFFLLLFLLKRKNYHQQPVWPVSTSRTLAPRAIPSLFFRWCPRTSQSACVEKRRLAERCTAALSLKIGDRRDRVLPNDSRWLTAVIQLLITQPLRLRLCWTRRRLLLQTCGPGAATTTCSIPTLKRRIPAIGVEGHGSWPYDHVRNTKKGLGYYFHPLWLLRSIFQSRADCLPQSSRLRNVTL